MLVCVCGGGNATLTTQEDLKLMLWAIGRVSIMVEGGSLSLSYFIMVEFERVCGYMNSDMIFLMQTASNLRNEFQRHSSRIVTKERSSAHLAHLG